jgi:hypothetical protein
MSLDDWNDGWIEGRKDGIEECIALMEALHVPREYDGYSECNYCDDIYWPPQIYPCDSVAVLRSLRDRE